MRIFLRILKSKIFLAVLALMLIAGVAAFNVTLGTKKSGYSDLLLANVEALALPEDGKPRTIGCANDYVPVICKFECSCGAVWKANGGYGTGCCPEGTCACGITYYL